MSKSTRHIRSKYVKADGSVKYYNYYYPQLKAELLMMKADLEVCRVSIKYRDKHHKKEMEQIQSDHFYLGIVCAIGYLLLAATLVL